jgi:phage-related protein
LLSHKGCLSSKGSSKVNPVPRIFRQHVEFARSGNPETTKHFLQASEPTRHIASQNFFGRAVAPRSWMSHMLITGGFVDMATNKTRRLYARAWLAPLLALAMLFWVGTPASGQNSTSAMPTQDNDTTRRELANMDQFFDSHREVAEQLRKDPSLINNTTWVAQHPALQEFLQTHPGVREEFTENPNGFMRHENRFDRREDDRDTTRRELANMDQFLDSHREVAEQLRKDPSLIDNRQWVEKHPALQEFLETHPGVREEFRENPNAFMQREERFDRREELREGDRDTTRRQLASMDRFLDNHQEVAEQLRKDPSLIDNRQWVENHPALQQYLQSHPEVREEFRENPNAFMQAEMRYDQREDQRNNDVRGEMAGFSQFLGGHATLAEQLSKDPSLANNKEFLANHPELGEFLKTHPGVTQQLATNPQAVMSSTSATQASGMTTKASTPKVKVDPNR